MWVINTSPGGGGGQGGRGNSFQDFLFLRRAFLTLRCCYEWDGLGFCVFWEDFFSLFSSLFFSFSFFSYSFFFGERKRECVCVRVCVRQRESVVKYERERKRCEYVRESVCIVYSAVCVIIPGSSGLFVILCYLLSCFSALLACLYFPPQRIRCGWACVYCILYRI